MARATARPAIGFASGGLPPRAAGLAGDACWRSLVGAEKLPAGTQWASRASYVALMTWPSVRVDSLKLPSLQVGWHGAGWPKCAGLSRGSA